MMSADKSKSVYMRKIFISNKLSVVGAAIVCIFILIAALGPMFISIPPDLIDYDNVLAPPSSINFFGTDQYGRDLFSRVISGARTSLGIGFIVVAFSTVLGETGRFAYGISFSNCCYGIGYNYWRRNKDFNYCHDDWLLDRYGKDRKGRDPLFKTKRLCNINPGFRGEMELYIVLSHLTQCFTSCFSKYNSILRHIILNTAGLSFIGVGVQPPISEWGLIISEGRQYIVSGQWWLVFFPGLAIMLTVTGLNLLGDGLRDICDPRQRR